MEYANLVGIPYEEKDCWKLVKDFYSQIFKVSLNHIYDGPPQDRPTTRNLISSNRGEFVKTDSPKFGDIILFNILGIESHIGVFLEEDKFLHSSKRIGSAIERVTKWEKNITGFYTLGEINK